MKGVERRTQLLDDLRNKRRYWELQEEAEDANNGNVSLSIEHKEEIHIFHKSMDLQVNIIIIIITKEEAEDRNRWKRQIINRT